VHDPVANRETIDLVGSMKTVASLAATLVCSFAASAAAQTSAAEPAAVVLHWSAPAECPTGDQVLDDARTLAVHRDAAAPRSPVAVDAVVDRLAEGRWSLTLSIGAAQQRLEASSCAQLARAGALFVALIMDPSRGDPPRDAPGEAAADAGPPPPSAPAPNAAATRPAQAVDARAGPREVSVLAAAGMEVDVGTLPRAELLGALEVGIRYRRMEVSLRGTAGPAQDKTLLGAAGARLRPISATLTPCYAPLVTGVLRLGPCARGEVGWMHAEGLGVAQPRVTDAAWLSLGGELAAWLALGAYVEARLGAGVLVPAVRPNFQLTGVGNVFEPGVALRGDVAAVLRF
jgi:hypothetical protein